MNVGHFPYFISKIIELEAGVGGEEHCKRIAFSGRSGVVIRSSWIYAGALGKKEDCMSIGINMAFGRKGGK